MSDVDLELTPPGQAGVVDRVLCLTGVSVLGAVAADFRSGAKSGDQADAFVADVRDWLGREGVDAVLTATERRLVAQPPNNWTEREMIDAGWRVESIGVFLWALSIVDELPPYDRQFEDVPSLVPLLEPTADFREGARLRGSGEIGHARDLAELWHWRSRTTELQQRTPGPSQYDALMPRDVDLDAIVKQTAVAAHANGGIPAPIGDDFPAFAKPYRDLEPDEYSTATSIAMERHYAFNWLCGYSSDWDDVPTDT